LDEHLKPGLGAWLHEALARKIPVAGVAKTSFKGAAWTKKVRRAGSNNPLFVTAVGVDVSEIANLVHEMHGEFRLPTLIKRVDSLVREGQQPGQED
jgi:deoxyribonuclease V